MNAASAIMTNLLMRQVGWALVHSMWQGALVGTLFVVLRFVLRRRSAKMRYLAGCACLGLLAAAPVLTFLFGLTPSRPGGFGGPVASATQGAAVPVVSGVSFEASFAGRGAGWSLPGGVDFIARLAPVVAMGWLLGVVVFSARLTRCCWWVRSIRMRENEGVDPALLAVLENLRLRLGVSRPVRLLKSALVEVPTVIGWLRPVILLPAATLSGLTPGQLEAILAHELAHVRRFDYIVNGCQCLVETLMFYHPVVWWISRCIREERENCCDDLVVAVCGDRLGYARALATLEGLRAEVPGWAFAASGGSLLGRIRRLVGRGEDQGPVTAREAAGLALLGIGLVLIVLGIGSVLSPRAYQATARVRIERDQSAITGLGENGGTLVYDPYFIQTEFEMIQSEAVLGRAVVALHQNKEWSKRYANGELLKMAETIALLRGRLDLRPIRNTSLVEIRVYSESADEAVKIANAVAEAYKAYRQEQRVQMTRGAIKALEDRFAEQEAKVKKAQQRVDELRLRLGISDALASGEGPDATGENAPPPLLTADTVRKLESLRIETKAEYVRQVTLVERLKNLQKELGPEALMETLASAAPDTVLNTYVERLGAAEQQLVALSKEFGPQHMEVVKVKSQIEDLHNKIKNRVEGIMLGLDTRALSLSNSLDNLEKEVGMAITNDVMRAQRVRPYFQAKRTLDELQRFRTVLDMKIAGEKIDLELPKAAMVEIVDRAVPASRPASPNTPLALALILFGVVLDAVGFRMLTGRPRTGSEPQAA